MKKIILALALLCSLGGCAGLASNLGSQTPAQVKTLAEAEQAATVVTSAVDVWVRVKRPDAATRAKIGQLSDTLHAALVELETARRANKSLVFDSFNAALKALNAYKGN